MTKANKPGYQLPEIIVPEENICVCVPLPKDWGHIRAFLGQIVELGYWYNWERDDDKRGREAAAVWREIFECINEEVNCIMSTGCGCGGGINTQVVIHRTNPDTGYPEISTDDGVTWVSDPESIYNKAVVIAPIDAMDTEVMRCEAANNVVENMKDLQQKYSAHIGQINNLTDFIATLLADAVALLLTGIVGAALLPFITVLIPKIIGVARDIFNTTQEDYDALFTTDVWNDTLCIVYCLTPDDGEYTEQEWSAIRNQLLGKLGSGTNTAGANLESMVNVWGVEGLKNASRLGSGGEGNCDDCECTDEWWYEFDFRDSAFNKYFAIVNDDGQYQSGVGYKVVLSDGYEVRIEGNFGFNINLIGWIIEHQGTDLSNYNRSVSVVGHGYANLDTNATPVIDGSDLYAASNPPLGALVTSGVGAFFRGAGDSGHSNVRFVRIVLHGRGYNPFGADNYVYDPMNP